MRFSFILKLAPLVLGALACGGNEPSGLPQTPPPGPMAGTWRGLVAGSDTLELIALIDSSTVVKGTGILAGPNVNGGRLSLFVSGRDSAPNVRLFLAVGQHMPAYLSGTMLSSTQLTGVIDSSGFNHSSFDLRKQ